MKNLFLGLFMLAGTAMFASNSVETSEVKKEVEVEIQKFKSGDEKPECVKECSTTIGGVTYSTSAGNFLSSCERAARRCQEKLAQLSTLN